MEFILVPFYRQKLRRNDFLQITVQRRTRFFFFFDSLSSAHSPATVRGPMELIMADFPHLTFVADP